MTEEQKRANFKRIATARTNKIINQIELLANLSNSSFYSYEKEQIKAIFEAIEKELETTKKAFKKPKKTKSRFNL